MTFLRNAVALEKTEHFFSYGTGSIYFSRSQFADDRNLYDIFLLFLALQYIQGAGEYKLCFFDGSSYVKMWSGMASGRLQLFTFNLAIISFLDGTPSPSCRGTRRGRLPF